METPQQPAMSAQVTPSGLPRVSELFSKAWELFKMKRRSAWRLALYAFLLQAGLSIVGILIGLGAAGGVYGIVSGNSTIGGSVIGVSILLFLLLVVAYLFLYAWIQAAFIFLFSRNEAEPDVPGVISQARPLVGPLWWASILVGLVVIVGFFLLIIPGIIFAVWYSFTIMVVVLEGLRGNEAMRKSKSYVQGRWLAVAGRIIILGIVVGLVGSIADSIFQAFGNYGGAILSSLLTAFVFVPFTVAYQYLLYKAVSGTKTA